MKRDENEVPRLGPAKTYRIDGLALFRTLGMRKGFTPLRAEILKVPHHCSKNGVTVEVAAMVNPRLALVSSLGEDSGYGFPHALAQGALREARDPIAQSGVDAWPQRDDQMGIHYTGGKDTEGNPLGPIGLVIKPTGKRVHLWRFLDSPSKDVSLDNACRYAP